MDFENAMPIGKCVVCDEYLDHSDAGFCKTCGQGFHWGNCGGWVDGNHECNNCNEEEN